MYQSNSIIFDIKDRTTDQAKRERIKRMADLIEQYFIEKRARTFSHVSYDFNNTELYIDNISVSVSIYEYIDHNFLNKPENINKYGIFKIVKIIKNEPVTEEQNEIYKELEHLFNVQETNEDESFIQNSIREIIEKSKIIEPYGIMMYNQPMIPQFLRANNILMGGMNPFEISQQIPPMNIEEDDALQFNEYFKYALVATIPESLKKENFYEYKCKVTCDKFYSLCSDNIDKFTLLNIYNIYNIEDAIESLQIVINSFKFFDGQLLSPNDFLRATLERDLFPLHENLNCCICLIPTMGLTSCNHRICFNCRYVQITKDKDKKRTRCPVCRKKNELGKFIEESEEDYDCEN